MEQVVDSDRNSAAMLATKAFEKIIDDIRGSKLNFQLQMSPFAAHISLKKSLIKDKSGMPQLPSTIESPTNKFANSEAIIASLVDRNLRLEKSLNNLKEDFASLLDKPQANYLEGKLPEHENVNVKKEFEDNLQITNLQEEIKILKEENDGFREKIKEQEQEILALENTIKVKVEISNKLNKQISEMKIKNDKEFASVKKLHRSEVKLWKKELGEERKERIKLEKELEYVTNEHKVKHANDNKKDKKIAKNVVEPKFLPSLPLAHSEVLCSICGVDIPNFEPKYFLGEMFNPACSNCDDSFEGDNTGPDHTGCQHEEQCVLRQPYPPPSPLLPFLVHEVSQYHVHMMRLTVDDLAGCIKCFSINNENYGCDRCTWLKWWYKWHGDRH